MKDKNDEMRKPSFEQIFGIYDIQPGYQGVVRRFGNIVRAVGPGRVWGIPFIDEIAVLPEEPLQIPDHEKELYAHNNRLVKIVSHTTVVIDDPIAFMRKAPERNYGDSLLPRIDQATQEVIRRDYASTEVAGKNDEVSAKVKDKIQAALHPLGWGLLVQSFSYTSSIIDPADIIDFNVATLRPAELTDAIKKGEINLAEKEAAAKADSILKKYSIDAAVYGVIKEGEAAARVMEQTGIAEAAILEKRIGTYTTGIGKVITDLSSRKVKIPDEEKAVIVLSALETLTRSFATGKTGEADSLAEKIKKTLIGRLKRQYEGKAEGEFLRNFSAASGVNPTVAHVAEKASGIFGRPK